MTLKERGRVVIMPVMLRPMELSGSGLEDLATLPAGNRPVITFVNRDDAWLEVANAIRQFTNVQRPRLEAQTKPEIRIPEKPFVRKGLGQFEIFLLSALNHRDAELVDELEKHLAVMKRSVNFAVWRPEHFWAGEYSNRQFEQWAETADLVVLLISQHSLSDARWHSCFNVALRRYLAGEALLVAVILRPVMSLGTGLEHLPTLPENKIPVVTWPDRDEAWAEVTRDIGRIIGDAAGVADLQLRQPPLDGQVHGYTRQPKGPIWIVAFCAPVGRDEQLLAEMMKHLHFLQPREKVRLWSPREIAAGADPNSEIAERIERADIILLLVSSDSLASDRWYEWCNEALQQRRNRPMSVVPVLLRPVDLKHSSLNALTPLPRNAIPVTRWESIDAAWDDVKTGIQELIETMSKPLRPDTA